MSMVVLLFRYGIDNWNWSFGIGIGIGMCNWNLYNVIYQLSGGTHLRGFDRDPPVVQSSN